VNGGICGIPAILDFKFCIYSIQEAFAESFDRITNPLVLDDVDSDPRNHGQG